MAQGDAVIGAITSVAAAASLTVQPSSGAWLLKNIQYGGAVEVYLTDGTNSILVDSDGAAGEILGKNYLLSNTQYMTVKNVSAGAIFIRYDAVVWA